MRSNRKHLNLVRKEVWMRVKNPDALRRKRVNRRYSQRDLAMLVKRSQTTIYLLETGQMKTLSEDLALHIAARLDVDWEDFFDLEEHEVMPTMKSDSHPSSNSPCESKPESPTKRGGGKAPGMGHETGHGIGKVA